MPYRDREDKRRYQRDYMRCRRLGGGRGASFVRPYREGMLDPAVSRKDVFTDTVLPTREANERSTVTISSGNHVVNPRTGEILGVLDNTGRMDKLEAITGILEQRIANLSYAIAEMQATAIGRELSQDREEIER